MKSANSQKALSSPEAVDKRTVEVIDQYLERNAVSKAIARVAEPLHFASGSSVPSRLRSMFPKPMHAQPSQAPCGPVSDELKEALIAFIDKELQRLQSCVVVVATVPSLNTSRSTAASLKAL